MMGVVARLSIRKIRWRSDVFCCTQDHLIYTILQAALTTLFFWVHGVWEEGGYLHVLSLRKMNWGRRRTRRVVVGICFSGCKEFFSSQFISKLQCMVLSYQTWSSCECDILLLLLLCAADLCQFQKCDVFWVCFCRHREREVWAHSISTHLERHRWVYYYSFFLLVAGFWNRSSLEDAGTQISPWLLMLASTLQLLLYKLPWRQQQLPLPQLKNGG